MELDLLEDEKAAVNIPLGLKMVTYPLGSHQLQQFLQKANEQGQPHQPKLEIPEGKEISTEENVHQNKPDND